jgi:hypothetical protein
MTTEPCTLCGREPPEHPMKIEVCGACYQELHAAGALALQTTGEFQAMTPERVDKLLGTTRPRSMTGTPGLACTWCGKQREQVKKILSGPVAHICNECVALCANFMEDEIGPDWR